jgi:hypothetical protein
MTQELIYFFSRKEPALGFFHSFLGGAFLFKGMPLVGQLLILLCLTGALWFAATSLQKSHRLYGRTANTLSVFLFTLVCLFLIQPWDELFTNLRHSSYFAKSGRFSFSPLTLVEGTVDFLPYLSVGVFEWLGLKGPDSAFLLCYLSGISCLFFSGKLFLKLGGTPALFPFFLLALCVFPPLGFNSSHGFATTFFAATILAGIYYTYFSRRPYCGLLILSLLPLVRFEGSFFLANLLFWPRHHLPWPQRKTFRLGVMALTPAIAHALVRHFYFGHAIPLPVQYKASFGNLFMLALGIRNLAADALSTHTFALILGFIAARSARGSLAQDTRPRLILVALVVSTLPYYLSGGDWFPSYWARYLFPLTLFSFCAAAGALTHSPPRSIAVPGLLVLLSSIWPLSSTYKMVDAVFSHRRTLAMIDEPTIARGHYRIEHLARLGKLIGQSSLATDRIASSELSTMPYFADREVVDFLGLTNPKIAQSPLRQAPSLIRAFPFRSELPFLIFRREVPDLLEKDRPEFLYTFDFMLRDQLRGVTPYEMTKDELMRAIRRWENQLGGLVDSLYGGIPLLLQRGYSPVFVRAGEDFIALYFVHSSALSRHFEALQSLGFHGGKLKNTRLAVPSD